MKISQLPPDVKEKALYYFNNDPCNKGKDLIDNIEDSFEWGKTKEGHNYWADWYDKEFIEIKEDSIVESIRKQFLDRSNVGIQKYGVTLDREDLSLLEWLEHTKQEQMDSVLYLEKAIQQLKNTNLDFPHRQS